MAARKKTVPEHRPVKSAKVKTFTVYVEKGHGHPEARMRLRPGGLDPSILFRMGLELRDGDRVKVDAEVISRLETVRRKPR